MESKAWKDNNTLREGKERWVDRGYCTLKEWPDLKVELEDKWRKKYKDATAKIIKFGMRGQRFYVVETKEE